MSGPESAKNLLIEFNRQQYRTFTLNNNLSLQLPSVSIVPTVGASKRIDQYEKTISHPDNPHHIKFITKNNQAHSIIWQTQTEQLRKGVRWGIIKPQSITGKVISALGHYRLVAIGRVAKGMISNSQTCKLKLLDLYQDRFEALQGLESLTNKSNNLNDFTTGINNYTKLLGQIRNNADALFKDVLDTAGLDKSVLSQIKNDINSDIKRAQSYLDSLANENSLRSQSRARGVHSIMEFVKQQMVYGLYEFQGINQDISYNLNRRFALTRGELNDFIEDARKEIDVHQADLRNVVTPKHHGQFSSKDEELVSYDFSEDALSPNQERDTLLAISFIEGWDKIEQGEDKSYYVSNDSGVEKLNIYSATRWQTHRSVGVFFKNFGYYFLNVLKGVFISTQPWEEETWDKSTFHLVAAELRKKATPNEPMWQKPFKLFKSIVYAVLDVFGGIRDFGSKLVIKMPDDIINDWLSTQAAPSFQEVLKAANKELNETSIIEKGRLEEILNQCNYVKQNVTASSTPACVEYKLTGGEQNDILTAMARGLNEFGTVFSHNLFAKNPIAGVAFTSAFALGAGAIYLPTATASIFGTGYVTWFNDFAFSLGGSKMAASIAGGSTQAQFFASFVDGISHGTNGIALDILYQLGEDPLTVSAYFAGAYALGYFLVNGIAGHPIPWLSEILREDLGTAPQRGYPFIGAKFAIVLYEGLVSHKEENFAYPELSEALQQFNQTLDDKNIDNTPDLQRCYLLYWLSKHSDELQKLQPKQQFELTRQIELLFNKEESDSLKKLIHPEQHASIAFQLLSIPLTYIPAVLRLVNSFALTIYALISNQKNPYAPLSRATLNLWDKSKRDLSRLIPFTSYLIYIPYHAANTFLKVAVYSLTMIIGRIASLFGAKPAHSMHQFFATVHSFIRTLGELMFPVRAIKNVTIAHPTHTIMKIDSSYKQLMQQMKSLAPKADLPLSPLESEDKSQVTGAGFFLQSEQNKDFSSYSSPTECTVCL